MADFEEPPSKVSKFALDGEYLEGDMMDEGQEEWLSEGILTDDDYNPTAEVSQESISQDESMLSIEQTVQVYQEIRVEPDTSNSRIEDTLNSLENAEISTHQEEDFPEDLAAFLIRKTDGAVVTAQTPEKKEKPKSDDDGNDTDELLRMLGDDEKKPKNRKNSHADRDKAKHEAESSDDDEFVFDGKMSKQRTIQVANTIIRRVPATKAEPEDDDITDCSSSDEKDTVKKMFESNVKTNKNTNQTTKVVSTVSGKNISAGNKLANVKRTPGNTGNSGRNTKGNDEGRGSNTRNRPQRQIVQVVRQSQRVVKTVNNTTPKQVLITKRQSVEKPKTLLKDTPKTVSKAKESERDRTPNDRNQNRTQNGGKHQSGNKNEHRTETEQKIILKEKNLTEEKRPEEESLKIMKPEVMDEEVPSDLDSNTDDEDSLYDELPSSDSETLDDWFSIDIRAERAGDFLPLLGNRAHEILSKERQRVTAKVEELKKSLSAITESGREQAERLRKATLALAELDAALGAA